MADVVGQVPGQLPTFTSGHNPQAGVPGGGTVTAVSATAPLAATPDPIVGAGSVGFPSWPADLAGELHNDGAGVLSWITDVGSFVRLLADPTIDQDVGGFHVTLSGLSDTAFLVNTLTNPSAAKFRALGTTSSILELEYTTVAANMFAGLSLLAPTGAALVINLFGSGTSGAAVGWDGGDYDLPSGAVLYGGITDSHWFKLSGSTDHCGTFQLYDNGLNFFPALSLVSIDGGAAVGAVTVGANPRINAIPPDFSVFHGATTATGLGTERIRITNDDSEGPGTAKLVFGNLPAFATMSGNTSRDFQFVGNVANTNLLLNSNGPGTSQFSLYSLDGSGNGDGIHLICYAQDGVEPSEYAAFNVGAFERWQIPYTGTAILSDNTEFILEANYAGGLDGQLCLYSARVGNTATTDTRVTFGAESQTGADADFVLYTGGTESLRISGATKKVTMPGVLDPPEIHVINKTPSDTATATVFMAATDSGANTSNVSVGIELPNSVGAAGDLVASAGTAKIIIKANGRIDFNTVDINVNSPGYIATTADSPAQVNVFGTNSASETVTGSFSTVIGAANVVGLSNTGSLDSLLMDDANHFYFGQTPFPASPSAQVQIGSSFSEISLLVQTAVADGSNDKSTAVLRANTAQAANLLEMQALDSSPVASFAPSGLLTIETSDGFAADPNALFVRSLYGISALFQTLATDGSNAYPTAVFAGNTGQTTPLTEWRGTDGATVVGQFKTGANGDTGLMTVGTGPLDALSTNLGEVTASSLFGMSVNKVADDTTNFSKMNVALDAQTPQAWLSIGEAGTGIGGTRQLWVGWEDDDIGPRITLNADPDSPGQDFISFNLTSTAAQEIVFNFGVFAPNTTGLDLGADGFGFPGVPWKDAYIGGKYIGSGLGSIAAASIGSGDNGTVNLVADDPGIAGNEFTATVAAGVGLNVPMTAAFTLQALLVTLGTDGAGALDPAKNTATLIAGAINTAAGGVTATASGTGADPLTGAEGPTTFTGGAESLTLAGGFNIAGTGLYLPNLPGSDPGIPGALYQTAGAVMVSL